MLNQDGLLFIRWQQALLMMLEFIKNEWFIICLTHRNITSAVRFQICPRIINLSHSEN